MSPSLIQEVAENHAPKRSLELVPVEQTLKRLLLDVAKYVDETPSPSDAESQVALPSELAKQRLELRFAGGWVRDKLLGQQSHDIDVAINKMTGYHFGLRLKEYLELPGNLEKYGLESIAANDKQSQKAGTTDKSKMVGGLHKIEANPEKSKNLETTTMRVLGLDIDLVNLRKEVYADDSRNPTIEFGTPEEDAIRRDATVNAMFYNINTDSVEDLTGKGHDDMRSKILRTPLEPYQTFKDDPLRVLRLIRFASRLGYTIDPKALKAMGDRDIKDALQRKISRERVGIELEKALRGPDPHEAMRLIFDIGLYETIFSDPALSSSDHYQPNTEGWQIIIDCLNELLDDGGVLGETLARDREERFLAWQLAAFVPHRDAPEPDPPEPGKKAPPLFQVQVAKEGIKATNKTCEVILASVRHQTEISAHVDHLFELKRRPDKKQAQDPNARDILGMAIRRWGSSWRSQIVYSMLVDIANNLDQVATIQRKYQAFVDQIRTLDLLDVCNVKPLIDGKVLAKAIETPPGPWMKDALDVVMAWQLRNPHVKDPQGAINEVKTHQQQHGELTSDLLRHFLKLTIRPIFSKASPASVTPQGRKAIAPKLAPKMTVENMDDEVKRPWKTAKDAYAIDLLRWVCKSLDATVVEGVWPLVVPPILTLIDDWEARYKQIGADLLLSLLKVTPSPLLHKTGLGDVFEEALVPCLTFLPSITPEDQSIALLSTVYPCLRTLASVRYPKLPAPANEAPRRNESDEQRTKAFDTILRRGIIYGCTHCNTHPNILCVLFRELALLLDGLGIDAVKHIKYLLPLLNASLSHPLAGASPHMLSQAVLAVQALIRNCWPRMVEHRAGVLKGVTLCWLQHSAGSDGNKRAGQAATAELGQLEAHLKDTVQLLEVAVMAAPGRCDFSVDCAALVAVEPRLAGLFDGVGRR